MTTPADGTEPRVTEWERRTGWVLTGLAVLFLVAYAIPILFPDVPPVVHDTAAVVDVVVWLAFAADYAARLLLAERRWRFVCTHLLDLLVVVLPPARQLRLARVVFILLRTGAAQATLRPRSRLAIFVGSAVTLMVLVSGLAVLDAERGAADASITTYPEALWWTVVTVTTVGYGDYYPVTFEGKVVAVALMLTGIGLIAFVTGSLASWIVERVAKEEEESESDIREDIGAVLTELRELRAEVADLRRGAGRAPGGLERAPHEEDSS